MSGPLNVEDWERLARERVDPSVWCYFEGGSDDEVTLRDNVAAFRRLRFRPRVLVDVDAVSAETEVLGASLSMPVAVAPIAYVQLLEPDGELALGRAAAAAGTALCVSTFTSRRHGEIASAAPGLTQWAQLYVFRDEGLNRAHLAEVVEAGCTALFLTVDTGRLGRRERDLRLGFEVPPDLPLPYARSAIGRSYANPAEQFGALSSSVGWPDLDRLAGSTRLPVVAKGIVTGQDAHLAVESGAAGIVVSNHGGRQLDGTVASLEALPEVVDAVADRVPVLLDGGIRRGTDVLKALALGATATLAGRAPIYGLAAGGEAGARDVLSLLRDEIELALALLGCTSIDQVGPGHVRPTVAYDLPA